MNAIQNSTPVPIAIAAPKAERHPLEYDDRLIDDCYHADLSDPDTARFMALVVEPNLASALATFSACHSEPAARIASDIRRALSAYRTRRDQRAAA